MVKLNCERHPVQSTVGRCLECGRDICPDCISETGDVLRCPECFSREVERIREMMGAGVKKAPRTKPEKAPKPSKGKVFRLKGKKAEVEEPPPMSPQTQPSDEPPEFVEAPKMVVAKPEEEMEELTAGPVAEPPEPWETIEAIAVEEETKGKKAVPAIEAREVVPSPPVEEVVFSAAPTADFTELISEEVPEEELIETPAPPIAPPVEEAVSETVPPPVEPALPESHAVEAAAEKKKEEEKPTRAKREKPPKERKIKIFARKDKKAEPELVVPPAAQVPAEKASVRGAETMVKKPGFEEVPRVITPGISPPEEEGTPQFFKEPPAEVEKPREKKKLFGRKRKEKPAKTSVAEIETVALADLETGPPAGVEIPEELPPKMVEGGAEVDVNEFGIPLKKKIKQRKKPVSLKKRGLFRKKVERQLPPSPPEVYDEPPVSPIPEAPPPVLEEEVPPVYEGEIQPPVEPPEISEDIAPPEYLEDKTGFTKKEEFLGEPPVYEEVPEPVEQVPQEPVEVTDFYFEEKSAAERISFEPRGEGSGAEAGTKVGEIEERALQPEKTDYGWSFDERPLSREEGVSPSAGVELIEELPERLDEREGSAGSIEDSERENKSPELEEDLDSFFFEEEKGKEDHGGREDRSSFWD